MPTLTESPRPPISERELDRSLNLNIAAGTIGMAWLAVANGTALPLLMDAINASGFQLGLLSGVRQFSMVAQILSALWVERLARRKVFWATAAMAHRALWLVPVLLPMLMPNRPDLWAVALIVSLGISDVLNNAATAPWFSWIADLLPPGRAGRFWGSRQRVLSFGLLVSSLAFGWVLDAYAGRGLLGFQIVFALGALFGMADIALHLLVHEPAPVRAPDGANVWQRMAEPMRDRRFRRLTWSMGFWVMAVTMPGYSAGMPSFFSTVYLKQAFGVSYAQASVVFVASAIGGMLWTPRIGHWIDHHGVIPTMRKLMIIGPVFSLAWLLVTPGTVGIFGQTVPQPVVLLSAASLVIGGTYCGVMLCQIRLTQILTSPSGRSVAMGVHWGIVGFMAAAGALLAGWLKDHWFLRETALVPGLAPFTYFQGLILLQVVLGWAVALPLVPGEKGARG